MNNNLYKAYLTEDEKNILFAAIAREKKFVKGEEAEESITPIIESLERKFEYDRIFIEAEQEARKHCEIHCFQNSQGARKLLAMRYDIPDEIMDNFTDQEILERTLCQVDGMLLVFNRPVRDIKEQFENKLYAILEQQQNVSHGNEKGEKEKE